MFPAECCSQKTKPVEFGDKMSVGHWRASCVRRRQTSADKTSAVFAGKSSVVSAAEPSAAAADKASVVSQDIPKALWKQGRSLRGPSCVDNEVGMSWQTTDVLSTATFADTTDVLPADTAGVLSADTPGLSSATTRRRFWW